MLKKPEVRSIVLKEAVATKSSQNRQGMGIIQGLGIQPPEVSANPQPTVFLPHHTPEAKHTHLRTS
uniref:Uncharacterized protein n=1 Tax=Anguilla anguilla TaxID=7936 RepID=A0A0E9VJ07_ANGAN